MADVTNRQLNVSTAGQIALNLDKLDDKGSDGKITKNVWDNYWAEIDPEGKYKGKHEKIDDDGIYVRDAMKLIMTRIFNAAKEADIDVNKIGSEWKKGIKSFEQIDANKIKGLEETTESQKTDKTETQKSEKTKTQNQKTNDKTTTPAKNQATTAIAPSASDDKSAERKPVSEKVTKNQFQQVKDGKTGEVCKGIYYHSESKTYYREIKGKLVPIKPRTGYQINNFRADGSHWESGTTKTGKNVDIYVNSDNKKTFAYEYNKQNGNYSILTTYDKNEKPECSSKYIKGVLAEQRDHKRGLSIKYKIFKDLGDNTFILIEKQTNKFVLFERGNFEMDYYCDETGYPLT